MIIIMVYIKQTSKHVNLFLIIFLIIVILITIFSALNPDFGQIFALGRWFDKDKLSIVPFWVAIGFTMLLCFLGALIPIPVPYALPVTLFTITWVNYYPEFALGLIILLVLLAAAANAVGDMLDYVIGRGAEYIVSQEDPEMEDRWSQIILKYPKAIPGVVMIFAVSPLPDSLLMVPLGVVKYDIKKTFLWMLIGKIIMMFIFALIGILALDITFSEEDWLIGVIFLYVMWGMLFVMIKVSPGKKE